MAHQNARMIPIADFSKGTNQAPGFMAKARGAAEEMENLVIGLQGRPQLRKGYIDADVSDVSVGTEGGKYASGDQLVVVHWLGEDEGLKSVTVGDVKAGRIAVDVSAPTGIKRIYHLPRDASWVQDERGRTLYIVSPDSAPYFIDLKTNRRYEWDLERPIINDEDLEITSVKAKGGINVVPSVSEFTVPITFDYDAYDPIEVNRLERANQIIVTAFSATLPTDLNRVVVKLTARTQILDNIQIQIHDIGGDLVNVLFDGTLEAGTYLWFWDLYNASGNRVAPGTYIVSFVIAKPSGYSNPTVPDDRVIRIVVSSATSQHENFFVGMHDRFVAATYANDELLIESRPSRIVVLPTFDTFENTRNREVNFGAKLTRTTLWNDAPSWANRIYFYASEDPPAEDYDFRKQEAVETGQAFRRIAAFRVTDNVGYQIQTEDTMSGNQGPELDSYEHDGPVDEVRTMGAYGVGLWAAGANRVYFNKIGNQGEQRLYALPSENALVPHSFPLSKSGQSPILHIHPSAHESALLAFKRDAIHVIKGDGVISGLYSPETAVQVDVDASSVIVGTGTSSPRSVVTVGSAVYFVGSDKKFWQFGSDWRGRTDMRDIGLPIQKYLDEISDDDLPNLVAFLYANCYHLITPDRVIVMDMTRKYWTATSWELEDAIWSRGGEESESILYAVTQSGDIVELYEGDTDGGAAIGAKWRSNPIAIPSESTLTGVMVVHTNNPPPTLNCRIILDDVEGESREFTPAKYNDFRFGTHASGSRVSVELESEDGFPRMDRVAAEIFLAR